MKRLIPVALRDDRCGSGEILPKSMSSLSPESLSFFLDPFLIGLNCNVVCFNPICKSKKFIVKIFVVISAICHL